MALVWDKPLFDSLYVLKADGQTYGYDTPTRARSLSRRTETLMAQLDFGDRILIHGGAYGHGGLPLLRLGKCVTNYDTSPFIHETAETISPIDGRRMASILPSTHPTGKYDTVFFEDSLADHSDDEVFQAIDWARTFEPALILVLTTCGMRTEGFPFRTREHWRTLLDESGNGDVKLVACHAPQEVV